MEEQTYHGRAHNMIKTCQELDKAGLFKASDILFKRYVESQFIQPDNNANWPIETRMIPWKELDETFKQRDKDWFTKSPSLRNPEYIALPGTQEPPIYPSKGGTSNIDPLKTKDVDTNRLNELVNIYRTYQMSREERFDILKQINDILDKIKGSSAAAGNEFAMQGPDGVPGPKNAIIDHSSPSMVGLDGFTWKQRKDVYNNPDDSYKQLLPL